MEQIGESIEMSKFYERYEILCKDAGGTPNGIAKQLGLPSASVTQWKRGTTPRVNTIEKIASFFDVSIDYLQGISDEKKPAPKGNEREDYIDIIKHMSREELLEFISLAAEEIKNRE